MEHSITKSTGISPFITGTELAYVKARNAEKVTDMPEGEALNHIIQIINRAFGELGQTPSGRSPQDRQDNMLAIAKLVLNDLRYYFPQVTVHEVAQAVRRGIREEYGQYYGFNVIAIHKFVESYLDSEERNNALAKQNRFIAAQSVVEEPSDTEKEKIMQEGITRCYQIFKVTGRIIDYGNVNYDHLVARGDINFTVEEKKQFYAEAEVLIKAEALKDEQQVLHLMQRRFLNKDLKPLIIARAKELALKRHFQEMLLRFPEG